MQVTDPLLIAREGANTFRLVFRPSIDALLTARCRSRLRWEAYPAGRSRKFWRQSNTPKPSAMLVHPLQ